MSHFPNFLLIFVGSVFLSFSFHLMIFCSFLFCCREGIRFPALCFSLSLFSTRILSLSCRLFLFHGVRLIAWCYCWHQTKWDFKPFAWGLLAIMRKHLLQLFRFSRIICSKFFRPLLELIFIKLLSDRYRFERYWVQDAPRALVRA